jgi:butyryl-CoA dehydrogenase
MQLHLSESHRMLQDLCRDFVRTEVKPHAEHLDQTAEFPKAIIDHCAQMGFMGIFVPSEYGGAHMDRLSGVLVVEALAQGCASTALIISIQNSLVCGTLLQYANEQQKKNWLPDLAQGKTLGCFCLTEPEAGSDAAALATTVELQGSSWVLNGTKTMVTNACEAKHAIVFARNPIGKGIKGVSVFWVPLDAHGVTIGEKDDKLGVRAASTAPITFKNVSIPKENLIGKPGMGFYIAMSVLGCGRLGIAAQALGIAQGAFDEAVKYAKQREQFGKTVLKFQGIQWVLADLSTELEAARLLVYRAATSSTDCQMPEAAIAKLFASDLAVNMTDKAIQIHGGYGYIKEFPVERFYRDAKVTQIYGGTSEIQRHVIAGRLVSGVDYGL